MADSNDMGFSKYIELLCKVDGFTAAAARVFGSGLACMAGCDECCGRSFSVFRVEAQNLLNGFILLGGDKRSLILEKCAAYGTGSRACVLLDNGCCMLYDYRPIICRTHGLPVTSSHISINGAMTTSTCPKNFRTPGALERLPRASILDLDTLNRMLTAVNMLYMKELDAGGPRNPPDRQYIHEIFLK